MRNRTATLLAAFAFLSHAAWAQVAVPTDTRAGRALATWLDGFNAADESKMRSFAQTYGDLTSVASALSFRRFTGGFTVVRIERSEPNVIAVLLQEKNSDTLARAELSLKAGESLRIEDFPISAVPRPKELAIARLPEPALVEAIKARAEALAAEDQFSGVILVTHHGKTVLEGAYGMADREAGKPNTRDTQFAMGSMTKMFTAISILQLVEAKKLGLEDRISKYLPDYPNKDLTAQVTVRQLLTHTGGTGNIFGPQFEANRLTLKELDDYVKLYGKRDVDHEPGSDFRYSNYGFILLGVLIEKVSGQRYAAYFGEHLFAPAGMTSTNNIPETQFPPERARGYLWKDGKWSRNTDTLPWKGTTAGGWYTTAEDLRRFFEALDAGKLVSKEMLRQATSKQIDAYGFGFAVSGEGVPRHYGHSGGAPGMSADASVYPDSGYFIACLSNLDPPAALRVTSHFANRVPAAPGP